MNKRILIYSLLQLLILVVVAFIAQHLMHIPPLEWIGLFAAGQLYGLLSFFADRGRRHKDLDRIFDGMADDFSRCVDGELSDNGKGEWVKLTDIGYIIAYWYTVLTRRKPQ